MTLLDRLYEREDFHQSTEYAQVMEAIGWSSIPVSGSRFAIRTLGPIALSKMQRPRVINIKQIRALCRKLHVVRFILEPSPKSLFIDQHGKKHVLSFLTPTGTAKAKSVLHDAGLYPTHEHYAHTKTALIDLSASLSHVVKSLPAKTRYNIKIAGRSGVTYTTVPFSEVSAKQKQDFFSAHEKWSKEKHILGFSNPFLDTVIRAFPTTGWLITAYRGTEFLGAMMVLIHDRIGYYFYTCTTDNGKVMHVPTGLTYEALHTSKRQGADIFDFCSVYDERYPKDHPRWKGFTTFKERFKPTSLYYPSSFARWF
jgi:lipid II:glycine glycyltransferase (peptidoglycan interpeptide bridge formation enzyme)